METLGDLERGFQLKLQGLACDSTSAFAHVLIAVSFWNQRRYDDVIVWANKALDRDPQHNVAREVLAGAYWKMGDLERAREHQQRGFEVARELLSDGTAQPEPNEFQRVVQYARKLETSTQLSSIFNGCSTRTTPRCLISPWRPTGTVCARIRGSTSVSPG